MLGLLRCAALAMGAVLACMLPGLAAGAATPTWQSVQYRTVEVDGVGIFYREAGDPNRPAVLLLHGYPTSSHMFRDLIPRLAGRYHVVAPDFPGFGFSAQPDRAQFKYTFDNLGKVMGRFTETIGLNDYALYVFDYSAPIGFRMALAHPERIAAIISQNGNVYAEGLSPALLNRLRPVWADPTEANRNSLRPGFSLAGNMQRYFAGVPESDKALISPDTFTLDNVFLTRPGNDEIQLDLLVDYKSNIELYPQFQEYLRKNRPPLLAIWGKNDPTFIPAGAEAFKHDVPDAEVHLLDAGHFALETRGAEIGDAMLRFLREHLRAR